MKYKVIINEHLQRIIEVESTSASGAITQIVQEYANGNISLNEDDKKGFEIKEYEEE